MANEKGRAPHERAHPNETPVTESDTRIAEQGDVTEQVDGAYAVIVQTPAGRHRRRVYLSLHAAEKAVKRAEGRGEPVWLVVCRLVALRGSI